MVNICDCRLFPFFRGNLGNKMFSYIILTFISKQFGLKTFTTKYVFHHIDKIFKISDIAVVEVVEDSLCQAFNGLTVIEKMDAFGYNEEDNVICDVEEKISLEYFTGHLGSLNKSELRKGKALIFHPYPLGYNIGSFDRNNNDAIIQDVNIPISLVREHFQFENYFTSWSFDVLAKIEKEFRTRKKLKKKKKITFVGIHNRRGDHIKDQVKEGVDELLPGYFLGGMDLYREKYKNVIFLYVSDDMEWGRLRLLPR